MEAAELASLRGLSRALRELYDSRDSTGDLVFTFEGEGAFTFEGAGGQEEVKAHRMIVAQRSAFFSALLRHRALEASTGRVSLSATEITRPTFLTLLHWVYTGAVPPDLSDEESFAVISAAAFIAESELVDLVLASVHQNMTAGNALSWLRVAMQGHLGDSRDAQLAKATLRSLLSVCSSITDPDALDTIRAALLSCSPKEVQAMGLNRSVVFPDDPRAAAWSLDAVPLLCSPRVLQRRTATFVNRGAAAIDVLWASFDGSERRYYRGVDNVDSVIASGRLCSWNSVANHCWRVYGADGVWLGGVVVEDSVPPARPSPCQHLFGFSGYIAASLEAAVNAFESYKADVQQGNATAQLYIMA